LAGASGWIAEQWMDSHRGNAVAFTKCHNAATSWRVAFLSITDRLWNGAVIDGNPVFRPEPTTYQQTATNKLVSVEAVYGSNITQPDFKRLAKPKLNTREAKIMYAKKGSAFMQGFEPQRITYGSHS